MHSAIALTTSFPAHSRSAAAKSKPNRLSCDGTDLKPWVYLASGYNNYALRTPNCTARATTCCTSASASAPPILIFGIDHYPGLAVIADK